MKTYALAAVLALAAAPVLAADTFDIRGVALGDTQEALQAALPDAKCSPNDNVVGDTVCLLRSKYGSADAFIMYGLAGGQVESVRLMFSERSFESVRRAMESKFGAGESVVNEVQNRMGAAFTSETVTWRAGDETLELAQRSSRLDESIVKLTSGAGEAAAVARMKAQQEADAANL